MTEHVFGDVGRTTVVNPANPLATETALAAGEAAELSAQIGADVAAALAVTVEPLTSTIAQDATTSAAIDVGNAIACGFGWPDAMTLTSATCTFLVSDDGVTFRAYKDDVGTAIGLSGIVQGTDSSLGNIITHFYGVRWFKIVMGTAQAAARTITLRTRQAA